MSTEGVTHRASLSLAIFANFGLGNAEEAPLSSVALRFPSLTSLPVQGMDFDEVNDAEALPCELAADEPRVVCVGGGPSGVSSTDSSSRDPTVRRREHPAPPRPARASTH